MSYRLKDIKLEKQNLFDIINSAIEIASKIGEHTIFIVGLTRAGKSTSFHWILNPNYLIGKELKYDEIRYVLDQKISTTAIVAQGYKSVTVLPNFGTVEIDGLMNDLLDMPGYEDTRNKDEVLGISYLIYQCFLRAKQMKFIIVIQETALTSKNGDQIIKTINGFIKMWRIKDMEEVDQDKFFDSVALLITTTFQIEKNYKGKLKKYIDYVAQLTSEYNSHLHIKLFTKIIDNERYGCFPAAEIDKSPDQTNILSILNRKNWKFISNKIDSIILPFHQDSKKLPSGQLQSLKNIIKKRIKDYEKLGQLINQLLAYFLSQMKNQNDYNKILCKSQFSKLQRFLIENSYYHDILNFTGTDQLLPQLLNIDKMNHIAQIYKIQTELDRFNEIEIGKKGIDSHNQYLKDLFLKYFYNILQLFCRSKKEEWILLNLTKVFSRGFRQFAIISKISEDMVSMAASQLSLSIQISGIKEIKFIEIYFASIRIPKFKGDQKTSIEIKKIYSYLKMIQYKYRKSKCNIFDFQNLNWHLISICEYLADAQLGLKKFRQAIIYLYECLEYICKYEAIAQIQGLQLRKQIPLIKRQIIMKIQKIFIQTKKHHSTIKICPILNQTHLLLKIYQQLISQQADFLKKYELHFKCIQELQKKGEHRIALQQLQKMKENYILEQHHMQKIKNKIVDMRVNQNNIMNRYYNKILDQQQSISLKNILEIIKIIHSNILLQTHDLVDQKLINQYKQSVCPTKVEISFHFQQISTIISKLVKKIENKVVIICFGSHYGTSTVVNWLHGVKMIERNQNNKSYFYPNEQANYSRINNRDYKKQQFPQAYQKQNRNEIIIDFPGIEQGVEQNQNQDLIISYLFMQNILKNAKKSKFILVLDANLFHQTITHILIFLQRFVSLLQNPKLAFNKFINSIEFIFTNRSYSRYQIVQKLKSCLKKVNQDQKMSKKQKEICKQLIQKMKQSFFIINFKAEVNQIFNNNKYLQKVDISQQKNKLFKDIFKDDYILKRSAQNHIKNQFDLVKSFLVYCASLKIEQILDLKKEKKKQIVQFCQKILIENKWIHNYQLKIKIEEKKTAERQIFQKINHLKQIKKEYNKNIQTSINSFIKLFELITNNYYLFNQLQGMFKSIFYEWKQFMNDFLPKDLFMKQLIEQVKKLNNFFYQFEIKTIQKLNWSQSLSTEALRKSDINTIRNYEIILQQFYKNASDYKNVQQYLKIIIEQVMNVLKIQCLIFIKQKQFFKALAIIFIYLHLLYSSNRNKKQHNFEIKRNKYNIQVLQKIARLLTLLNQNNIFNTIKCFKQNLIGTISEVENMILQSLYFWLAQYSNKEISQQLGRYLMIQNYGDSGKKKIFQIIKELNNENDKNKNAQKVIFNPSISDCAQYSYHLICKLMHIL